MPRDPETFVAMFLDMREALMKKNVQASGETIALLVIARVIDQNGDEVTDMLSKVDDAIIRLR